MKRSLSTILILICAMILTMPCSAESEQTTTIPVTLTVINTVKNIDVTMPAALPVSVLDGKVMTADNVSITNNSTKIGIEIASIAIENAAYTVESYDNFPNNSRQKIGMQINGCSTTGPGLLTLNNTSFPIVKPLESLPINYKAKVSDSNNVSSLKVASVIFTLRAVGVEE